MGYETRFNISQNNEDVIDAIVDISGYMDWWEHGEMTAKWYDWHKHCIEVSLKFPDALILVKGDGEEQGDVWKCYFKNGKSAVLESKLIWPDFDETMLE